MPDTPNHLPPDALAAFVELARQGSLRRAAERLFVSEQGVRSRLVELERRLGVKLYLKGRGRRLRTALTAEGKLLLPHAAALLDQSAKLSDFFASAQSPREIHVVASQYLIAYELIDAVRRFHRAFPAIRVRLTSLSESQIEERLLSDPDVALGVAAPYEASPLLEYSHLFSMDWSVVTPMGHPLTRKGRVRLQDIASHPLIFFERGSTGRQHVSEALQRSGLVYDVALEASNTDLIVRMVEAGLGVSIVPLHLSGAVTKGRKVVAKSLGKQVRPITSGVLRRREPLSAEAAAFQQHVLSRRAKKTPSPPGRGPG